MIANNTDNITKEAPNFDFYLVSLSNAFAHTFEEGFELAASMLDMPLCAIDLMDNVIYNYEIYEVNDDRWKRFAETRKFIPSLIKSNDCIHVVTVPRRGKMLYYNENKLTARHKKLVQYVSWLIFQFCSDGTNPPGFETNKKSMLLSYLLNEQNDIIESASMQDLVSKLPKSMQVLVCVNEKITHTIENEVSMICYGTEYIAVVKERYKIFLFPSLSNEKKDALTAFLTNCKVYGGVSNPFETYQELTNCVTQAIASLNYTMLVRRGYISFYEEAYALDVISHYASDHAPLSAYRHPIWQILEKFDSEENTQYYETLMAYLENFGNINNTAVQLGIHRNTVSYRLKQICSITGYDIQNASRRSSLMYSAIVETAIRII